MATAVQSSDPPKVQAPATEKRIQDTTKDQNVGVITSANSQGDVGEKSQSDGNKDNKTIEVHESPPDAPEEINTKPSDDSVDVPDGEEEDDNSDIYKQHNWPLENIKEPHENDVLYGRGGGTNHHPGNKRYRKLVEERKVEYVNSKRLEKPMVALNIIRKWRREQVPPGRFLKMNDKTGLWDDVGDKKAREKTSQALREKAPVLRKQQEEQEIEILQERYEREEHYFEDYDDGLGDESGFTPLQIERKEIYHTQKYPTEASLPPREKSTRFADGTKSPAPSKNIARPAFGNRLHSLGTELPDEDALRGFSWDDPMVSSKSGMPPPDRVSPFYDDDRRSRDGSYVGDRPIPMTEALEETAFRRDTSIASVGSFGSAFSAVPNPVAPRSTSIRSDVTTESLPPYERGESQHSLALNPLRHASMAEPALEFRSSFDEEEERRHYERYGSASRRGDPRHAPMDRVPMRPGSIPPSHSRDPYIRDPYYRGDPRMPHHPDVAPPSPYDRNYRPVPQDRHYHPVSPRTASMPAHPMGRTAADPYQYCSPRNERTQSYDSNGTFNYYGPGQLPEFARSPVMDTEIRRQHSSDYGDPRSSGSSGDYDFERRRTHRPVASFDSAYENRYTSPIPRTHSPYYPEVRILDDDRQLNSAMSSDMSPRRNVAQPSIPPFSSFAPPSMAPPMPRRTSPTARRRRDEAAPVPSRDVMRPMMKRDTSHQAEKPDVKKDTKMRRGVGRDYQAQIPAYPEPVEAGIFDRAFEHEDEMQKLAPSMAEINLGTPSSRDAESPIGGFKPKAMSLEDRSTTLDRLGDLIDDPADFDDAAWLDESPPAEAV